MSLRELYQAVIIDHSRKPRNFGALENFTHSKEGFNPLCGDKVKVYLILNEQTGVITNAYFQGSGCAISTASASLMTETVRGKTIAEAQKLFEDFHQVVTHVGAEPSEKLGKLAVLQGVAEFPARVKCATLAWHALIGAIQNNSQPITTENEGEKK